MRKFEKIQIKLQNQLTKWIEREPTRAVGGDVGGASNAQMAEHEADLAARQEKIMGTWVESFTAMNRAKESGQLQEYSPARSTSQQIPQQNDLRQSTL